MAEPKDNRGNLARGAIWSWGSREGVGLQASWGTWVPTPGCLRQPGSQAASRPGLPRPWQTTRCLGLRPWLNATLLAAGSPPPAHVTAQHVQALWRDLRAETLSHVTGLTDCHRPVWLLQIPRTRRTWTQSHYGWSHPFARGHCPGWPPGWQHCCYITAYSTTWALDPEVHPFDGMPSTSWTPSARLNQGQVSVPLARITFPNASTCVSPCGQQMFTRMEAVSTRSQGLLGTERARRAGRRNRT